MSCMILLEKSVCGYWKKPFEMLKCRTWFDLWYDCIWWHGESYQVPAWESNYWKDMRSYGLRRNHTPTNILYFIYNNFSIIFNEENLYKMGFYDTCLMKWPACSTHLNMNKKNICCIMKNNGWVCIWNFFCLWYSLVHIE